MNIVEFPLRRDTETERDTRLWNAYVAAAEKARDSEHIEDGLAARRAWIAFMQEFDKCC